MKIDDRNKLKEWLDQNYWFEDGFVSRIESDIDNLKISLGYQTKGTYVAGESQELKEFQIVPAGVSKWTWNKKHKFQPSYDWCIEGVDMIDEGLGLKFETPYHFEFVCQSIEISEPKTIETFTKPWTSNREFFSTVKDKQSPQPKYWIEQLRQKGFKAGFRYYCGELLDLSKVPYPDYSGYYLQHLDKIEETNEGLFFSLVKQVDSELKISIELKDETAEDLFTALQQVMSDWDNVKINSGNVGFTGQEWNEFKSTGKYPDRIEKIKNVWQQRV